MPARSAMFRWARLAKGLVRAGIGGGPVPLFASLELTLRCTGRCAYCGSAQAARPDRELGTQDWIAIVDDLARSGTLAVSLTGGEPLLRPDLPELVDRCLAHGMSVDLHATGRVRDGLEPMLRRVTSLTLSLDGLAVDNDAIRGPGAFEAAMDLLRTARSARVPVRNTAVLSRRSLPGLPEFLEHLRELSLPTLFQPASVILLRSGQPCLDQQPLPGDLRRAIVLLGQAKRAGVPVRNSWAGLDYLLDWPEVRPLPCPGGRLFLRVGADGAMGVCGLPGDPAPAGIDARDGVIRGMEDIAARPRACMGCGSAARAELLLALRMRPSAIAGLVGRIGHRE